MLNDYPEVLTIKDVAEILGIGERSVYELLKTKKLAGFILKNKWKITRLAVERFLNDNTFGKMKGGI